jgi:hypothetical protein
MKNFYACQILIYGITKQCSLIYETIWSLLQIVTNVKTKFNIPNKIAKLLVKNNLLQNLNCTITYI